MRRALLPQVQPVEVRVKTQRSLTRRLRPTERAMQPARGAVRSAEMPPLERRERRAGRRRRLRHLIHTPIDELHDHALGTVLRLERPGKALLLTPLNSGAFGKGSLWIQQRAVNRGTEAVSDAVNARIAPVILLDVLAGRDRMAE